MILLKLLALGQEKDQAPPSASAPACFVGVLPEGGGDGEPLLIQTLQPGVRLAVPATGCVVKEAGGEGPARNGGRVAVWKARLTLRDQPTQSHTSAGQT